MKKNKTKKEKAREECAPLTYLEVALAMMTRGQGTEYLEERNGPIPGQPVLVKAFFELKKRGAERQADLLRKFTEKHYPSKKQGRNAPEPGSRRIYKIQNQGGLNFARVPVETLKLGKGDRCLATFKAGQIIITVVPDVPEDRINAT